MCIYVCVDWEGLHVAEREFGHLSGPPEWVVAVHGPNGPNELDLIDDDDDDELLCILCDNY